MQMSPPPSSFGGFARNLYGSGFFLENHLICAIQRYKGWAGRILNQFTFFCLNELSDKLHK